MMVAIRPTAGALVEMRFRRFILGTFVLLTLGTGLWLVVSPYYAGFIAAISNGWFWLLGQSQLGKLVAEGNRIQVYHRAVGVTSPIEVAGFYAFFNLVVFLALLLATPGIRPKRRAQLTVIGTLAMVTVHLFTIHLNLRLTYLFSQQIVKPSRMTGWLIQAGQILTGAIGEQLFPLLIWGLLTLGYWTGDSRTGKE